MQVLIAGGTNAGWRGRGDPPAPAGEPSCSAYLRYYWLKCPNCETRRPD